MERTSQPSRQFDDLVVLVGVVGGTVRVGAVFGVLGQLSHQRKIVDGHRKGRAPAIGGPRPRNRGESSRGRTLVTLAQVSDRSQVVYEFARARSLEGWWLWALLVIGLVALVFLCVRHYRRDVAELSRPVRWTLMLLRLVSVVAMVFFFFDLQRRTQRLVTRPSEVVVLVDTSQSMSLPSSSDVGAASRSERVETLLAESELLPRLRQEHRVSVYSFDAQSDPVLLETRQAAEVDPPDDTGDRSVGRTGDESASPLARFGAFAIALGLSIGVLTLLIGAAGRGGSVGWLLLTAASCLLIGLVSLGSIYSVRSTQSLAQILGLEATAATSDDDGDAATPRTDALTPDPVDWREQIAATGNESRIGDAVRSVLADHEPSTLAGLVLMTDGQNNGGVDLTAAVPVAKRSGVSIYPIGLGSRDPPINVRVVDLDAPKRIYPGDNFSVSAVLQASGPEPVQVEVQLLDGLDDGNDEANADGDANLPRDVIDSQRITLNNDGGLSGIRFELEPETVGRRKIAVRIVAPESDTNERDDARSARYEVVARRLRVLAIAGGPTREYRFVRNLLYRDKSVELDVWLQTGQSGMSQDADRLLSEFPADAEALFQYDAIIMFDPDWEAIDMPELDLMDRWLAQQAGGLVLVAGPVYHPTFFRRRTDPRVPKVRGFFPVELATRGALLGGGRQGGENAWPLDFTPESRRAEFLWIADRSAESFEIWNDFEGVYDFVGVKGLKPGAKAYAYYSDPTTRLGDSLPVFLASQFYGAGRAYFQSSGEMWRLRGASDAYFDRYYTQLIRWVSEGRLLRDSNRGILLVDNSRAMVGDTIVVRAVLTDDQFEPLQVPKVPIKLLAPGGRVSDVDLLPLQGEPRPGTYGGRFVVREAGSYEVRLTIGDALREEVLRQNVQVRLPAVELERPQRNDAVLTQVADL